MEEIKHVKSRINFPTIVVIVLILVVCGWMFTRLFGNPIKTNSELEQTPIPQNNPSLTTTPEPGDLIKSWNILQEYFSAVKNRDLETINNIIYNRFDPKGCTGLDEETCTSLIWSMIDTQVKEAQIFRQGEFANVLEDNDQIIMTTDLYPKEKGKGYQKTFTYFIKSPENDIFILACGTRSWSFGQDEIIQATEDIDGDNLTNQDEECLGMKANDEKCIKTDPNQKDTDADGWWDSIEEAAGTDPNNIENYPFKEEY